MWGLQINNGFSSTARARLLSVEQYPRKHTRASELACTRNTHAHTHMHKFSYEFPEFMDKVQSCQSSHYFAVSH